MEFLTQKKSDDEDAVKSLWHDGLKLLVVTNGEKGCRYYTKAGINLHYFTRLDGLKTLKI